METSNKLAGSHRRQARNCSPVFLVCVALTCVATTCLFNCFRPHIPAFPGDAKNGLGREREEVFQRRLQHLESIAELRRATTAGAAAYLEQRSRQAQALDHNQSSAVRKRHRVLRQGSVRKHAAPNSTYALQQNLAKAKKALEAAKAQQAKVDAKAARAVKAAAANLQAAEAKLAQAQGGRGSISVHDPPTGWNSSYAACGALVFLSLVWYVGSFFLQGVPDSDYMKLGGGFGIGAVLLPALCYWILMPGVEVVLGYQATCRRGPPDNAYIIYVGFLCVHLFSAAVLGSSFGSPALCAESLMSSLPVLTLQMVIEHMDMATDVLFPGSAAACSELITPLWIDSWQEIPLVGAGLADAFQKLGFGGFALAIFITGAFLPQFMGVWSIFVPFFFAGTFSMVVFWVAYGWTMGAILIVGAFLLLIFLQYATGKYIWIAHCDFNLSEPVSLAVWSGLLIFADMVRTKGADALATRVILITLTKLIFENLLQLWIQSSLFALSFDFTDDDAKFKALLSLGLGLAVSFAKFGQFAALIFSCRNKFQCAKDPMLILIWVFGIAAISITAFIPMWVVAKILFAYRCPKHVWNLTSGCVVGTSRVI